MITLPDKATPPCDQCGCQPRTRIVHATSAYLEAHAALLILESECVCGRIRTAGAPLPAASIIWHDEQEVAS